MEYCIDNCDERVENKYQFPTRSVRMFCTRYRHPLTRDRFDIRGSHYKAGRCIKPEWCDKEADNGA